MSTQQLVHGTTAKSCGGLPFTSPEGHEALFHPQGTTDAKGWDMACGQISLGVGHVLVHIFNYVWGMTYPSFLIGSGSHIPSDKWEILHGQKKGFLRSDNSSTSNIMYQLSTSSDARLNLNSERGSLVKKI